MIEYYVIIVAYFGFSIFPSFSSFFIFKDFVFHFFFFGFLLFAFVYVGFPSSFFLFFCCFFAISFYQHDPFLMFAHCERKKIEESCTHTYTRRQSQKRKDKYNQMQKCCTQTTRFSPFSHTLHVFICPFSICVAVCVCASVIRFWAKAKNWNPFHLFFLLLHLSAFG